PYAKPAELVMMWSDNTHESHPRNPVSPADYLDLRSMTTTFERVEAMQSFLVPDVLRDGQSQYPAQAAIVTPGMFDLLGRDAFAGRTFHEGDTSLAVLSYSFWQRAFGGDRAVIGRTVTLNNAPHTIVGVMPADFTFPYRTMLGPTGFARAQTA